MKRHFFVALGLLVACHAFAAKPAPVGKRPHDFRISLSRTLRMNLSAKLYKSLTVSPLTAWVVAQAPSGGQDAKIIRSDAGGAYDKLALEIAKDWGAVGFNTTESRLSRPALNVHLLLYKIADGYMTANFSHNDEAFHHGLQRTDVLVAVYKNGKWTRLGGTKVTREYSPVDR